MVVAAASPQSLLQKYLSDALASELESEAQLQTLATEGSDEDVQAVFAAHAGETEQHVNLIRGRIVNLFGGPVPVSGSVSPFRFAPSHLALSSGNGVIAEERVLHNLLIAYAAETGEVAMYETLAALALAAADSETESIARKLQTEERRAADKLWHFLMTRSKLAFNMLTVSEIDPAVETKMADDRIV